MFWIRKGTPALVLAPMEGVTDYPMRALLTERGGFDLCVSEFLRISGELLPDRILNRHLPELSHAGLTRSGCPVMLQILGGDPELVAQTALQGVRLGALGIDINFGCPSPTVNRHDGGAALLKHPERIRAIIACVRGAVAKTIPVSAKLRLGWDVTDAIFVNAAAATEGGANWLTVHARTKAQGYSPPVHWETVRLLIREAQLPIVVNGDIKDWESFERCRDITQAEHFMIGRGALGNPDLARHITAGQSSIHRGISSNNESGGLAMECNAQKSVESLRGMTGAADLATWRDLLRRFDALANPVGDRKGYVLSRMKQWLNLAHKIGRIDWFDRIKQAQSMDEFWRTLDGVS